MNVDATYAIDVLVALGASKVAEIRDETCVLTGYDVEPDINIKGYAALASEMQKNHLFDHAATKRFMVETGGIVLNGNRIDTSRESQSLIREFYNTMVDANLTIDDFKASSGWVTIKVADAKAMVDAVGAHRRAAFAAEKAIDDLITAGTISDTEDIDDFAWPPNIS
jgi:hypothetical protein